MKPPLITSLKHPEKTRGFAIVSAIFLLVVIAALGTFIVTISSTAQRTSELDIRGDRAYQAARTGVEWGLYQASLGSGFCSTPTTNTLAQLPGNLAEFQVSVSCTSSTVVEGTTPQTIYGIVATASSGVVGSRNYVERQVRAARAAQ